MKILIIRNYPTYMNVKNNTYNIQELGLAKALTRKGHECDIVFWTDKNEETVEIPVDNIGTIHVFYRKGITFLKNTVYNHCKELFDKYDILQPCEYNQFQPWILTKKFHNKTVVYHGPYYSSFNKRYNLMCKFFDTFFLKRYIKMGTKFIVKSVMAQNFLLTKGIKSENICLAGVGLDIQMLSDVTENFCNEKIYQQMLKDNDFKKLLYIGRFEERRNIRFIIDVFNELCKKEKNIKLYLIGTGESAYIQSVFNYIEELGLSDRIHWQEKMEQKYLSEIYKKSDFFILPTQYEIFGMVLLEAMYYRNIVLTTENGGSMTLIRNEENGFVIKEMDAKIWADKILSCIKNPEQTDQIRNCAAKTIESGYTWDKLADIFLSQYNSLSDH